MGHHGDGVLRCVVAASAVLAQVSFRQCRPWPGCQGRPMTEAGIRTSQHISERKPQDGGHRGAGHVRPLPSQRGPRTPAALSTGSVFLSGGKAEREHCHTSAICPDARLPACRQAGPSMPWQRDESPERGWEGPSLHQRPSKVTDRVSRTEGQEEGPQLKAPAPDLVLGDQAACTHSQRRRRGL